jgi:hypothetical protein
MVIMIKMIDFIYTGLHILVMNKSILCPVFNIRVYAYISTPYKIAYDIYQWRTKLYTYDTICKVIVIANKYSYQESK